MKRWSTLFAEGRFGPARRHGDRDVIFNHGDPADAVYFLRKGAVEILHSSDDGRAVLVKILVGPCLFGTIEQLGREAAYLESVRVLGAAELVRLDAASFLSLMQTDVGLAYECLVDVGSAFCVAARHEPARLFPLEAQVAAVLLGYADATGQHTASGAMRLGVKRSQEDLAAAIGASQRSITRFLADWKKDGVIDKVAGRALLKDIPRLEALAGGLARSLVHRVVT
jgi:CRP/FNR family transcriptional regulator